VDRKRKQKMKTTRQYRFIDVAPMIREIMQRTGKGQNQTAELIGVSWMTVSFWLRGRKARPPYAAMVERAFRGLDRTPKVV
jgi:transcriptional regulator with XRE-family HTH domain